MKIETLNIIDKVGYFKFEFLRDCVSENTHATYNKILCQNPSYFAYQNYGIPFANLKFNVKIKSYAKYNW